jgi:hypothetical protein
LLTFCFIHIYTKFLVFGGSLVVTVQGLWVFVSHAFVNIEGETVLAIPKFNFFSLDVR